MPICGKATHGDLYIAVSPSMTPENLTKRQREFAGRVRELSSKENSPQVRRLFNSAA